MGLFNQFPFTNFHELNLDWIITKIKEIETRLQDSPYNPTIHTRPEEFGAYGDGIHDDSDAMQKCVDYARTNSKMIVSDSSRKYLITKTIELYGQVFINLNFATITTDNNFTGVLFRFNDNFAPSDICRIKVDGVYRKCTFMEITAIHHSEIHDLVILNVNNGFRVLSGYEAIVSNAIIFNGAGTHGNIAIEHNTWDASYNHIYAVNFNTVFKMGGGNNRINDCHCWNTDLQTYSGKTIFADIIEEYNIFSRCTVDTFHIAFKNRSNKPLFINDLLYYTDNHTNCTIFDGENFDGINNKTIVNGIYGNGRSLCSLCTTTFAGNMSNVFLQNFTDCKNGRYIAQCELSPNVTGSIEFFSEDCLLYVYGYISTEVTANTETKVAHFPDGFGPLIYARFPASSESNNINFISFSTNGDINISCSGSEARGIYINVVIPQYKTTT